MPYWQLHMRTINKQTGRRVTPSTPIQSSANLTKGRPSGAELIVAALSRQLSEQFKVTFDSPYTTTLQFDAEDPVETPLMSAMLRSQLIANWPETLASRGRLAKYQLLTSVGRPDRPTVSAFLLLARSRERESVTSSLRTYRLKGPLAPLRELGAPIVSAPWVLPHLQSDLAILAQVGHLLDDESSSAVADRLMRSFKGLPNEPLVTGRLEAEWLSALAAVLPGIEGDRLTTVSRWLLELATQSTDPLLLQSMDRCIRNLTWRDMDPGERGNWLAFIKDYLPRLSERQVVAVAVAESMSPLLPSEISRITTETFRATGSILHAALVLNLAEHPDSADVAKISQLIVNAVVDVRAKAAAGRFGYGSLRLGHLLATAAQEYDDLTVWRTVKETLTDKSAPLEMKGDILDQLARRPVATPTSITAGLDDKVTASSGVQFFASPSRFAGAWLRFRAAHQLGNGDELLSDLVGLATDPDAASRIEAARSLPDLLERLEPETVSVAGLLISQDISPDVMSQGAYVLPALLERSPQTMHARLIRRIAQLISSPGDIVPLAVLTGIQKFVSVVDASLMPRIEAVARSHLARPTRDAAQRLVRKAGRSMKPQSLVAIIVGSRSDLEVVQKAADTARPSSACANELRVISAHRAPDLLESYVSGALERGVKVFICAAGLAAHLPGRRRVEDDLAGDRHPDARPARRWPRRAAVDRPDAQGRARRDCRRGPG